MSFGEIVERMISVRELLDLHAQMDMAFWAKWMFWASMGTLLLSTAAVFFAFRSWQTSRQVGEVQTQAYVHASAAKFGSYGNIVLTCRNSGLTPATHFMVNATAKVVRNGEVSSSISFVNDGFKIWSALGTNDELTVSILDGNPLVRQFSDHPRENERLLISGQIIYCTIFNHDHMTQFAFYVDPDTRHRFRRPTANLTTFWRIPKKGVKRPKPPVPVLFDENETDASRLPRALWQVA